MSDRRILVLGSANHGKRVHAYEWGALPTSFNVADFDVVLLDFTALGEGEVSPEGRPDAEQFARLMFSDGHIVAVGNPELQFRVESASRDVRWWLPVYLPTKSDGGDAILNVDPAWAFWFQHVRGFRWHFVDHPQSMHPSHTSGALAAVPGASAFSATWLSLAETRYGAPLGVRIDLVAVGGPSVAARLFWLPSPTEISSHEGIDLVLKEVFEVNVESAPPVWMAGFRLPREQDAIGTVSAAEAALASADRALEAAGGAAAHESRFAVLLYERGKDVLEPMVREALGLLGATVEEASAHGIEDGRLVDPMGRSHMLEIKGLSGQLGVEDVRQLDGWMRNALASDEDGWDGQGLIVANLRLSDPPEERVDLIAPNALTFARRIGGIKIVTTSQLWEALNQLQGGTFDPQVFWTSIHQADVMASLPEPTQP